MDIGEGIFPLSLSPNGKETVMDGKARMQMGMQYVVTAMFKEILNYAEVAVVNKYQYSKLRSKILAAGNSAIQELQDMCTNYDIEYKPMISEIIEIDEKGEE